MFFRNYRHRTALSGGRTSGLLLATALSAALVFIPSGEVQAQAKVGTTGAQFLELGVSARAMGMAEAFVAVVDDVTAVFYNPAGLTALYGREVAATYVDMPAGVGYSFGAFGMPLESIGGVLGFGIYALSSGKMAVSDYYYPKGNGQDFSWNDLAVSVGYGRYLTDRFSVGFTVRYIYQGVHDYSASGWSADVGTLYDTGFRGFKLGMSISNFGPDMTLQTNAYPLPINFKFGGAINIIQDANHLMTFSAEGSHPSDNLEKYNVGGEYTFKDRFILRGGGRFNYDEDGYTVGGGIRQPLTGDRELQIDYAFQDFGLLTEVHRFTMIVAF